MNKKNERKRTKNILRYIFVVYAFISIGIVLWAVDSLICNDMDEVSNRLILNDGWEVTINNKEYKDISIDKFEFDTVTKGDKVVLETTLPNDWIYKEAGICISNKHTVVRMYIDDKLEYEYGSDRIKKGKTTGSGYLFINFYDSYKGKNIRFEFDVTESSAFSSIDEIWMGEWSNLYKYILTDNRLPFLLGAFLLVFGFFVAFVSVFATIISGRYRRVVYLALFSICVGVWSLCYYDVLVVFAIPLYSVSLMEYMSLFFSPIPIIAFLKEYVSDLKSEKMMLIYKVLFVTQVILTVVTTTLHTMNIMHGAQLLQYFHILFAVHVIYFSYVLIKHKTEKSIINKYSGIGMLGVCVCIMYDLCAYILNRYFVIKSLKFKGMLSLGIIIFIVILILDFYYDMTKNMMEEQEKAILIKKAYTDDLTQINNRGFCSQYMTKIYEEGIHDYTVINFDLNGLKQANDTYGHAKGDELICAAANVISEAFSSVGVVGRMGGDEFITIIESSDTKYIDSLIKKLDKCIKEANKENKELNLSISYGYASDTEITDGTPEKVYQLADNRMYENKKKYKRERSV